MGKKCGFWIKLTLLIPVLIFVHPNAYAQLDENCVINILNHDSEREMADLVL
jgi:hypothetical protein